MYEICFRTTYSVGGKSGKVRGSPVLRGQVKLFECCLVGCGEWLIVLNIEWKLSEAFSELLWRCCVREIGRMNLEADSLGSKLLWESSMKWNQPLWRSKKGAEMVEESDWRGTLNEESPGCSMWFDMGNVRRKEGTKTPVWRLQNGYFIYFMDLDCVYLESAKMTINRAREAA